MNLFYPEEGTFLPYQRQYFDLVKGDTLEQVLQQFDACVLSFLKEIPEMRRNEAYAPGKWTVQQVVLHMHDNDLVFLYRLMSIIRGERDALPGYDQDGYAANTKDCTGTLGDSIRLYGQLRAYIALFLKSLSPGQLTMAGIVNGSTLSVMTIVLILFGHPIHHCAVLKERYLR